MSTFRPLRPVVPRDNTGAVAVLLALWAFFWWRLIGGGEVPIARDLTTFAVPVKQYLLASVAAGHFPW